MTNCKQVTFILKVTAKLVISKPPTAYWKRNWLYINDYKANVNDFKWTLVIRKNGDIKTTRPIEKVGAHAKGHNASSIGVCYEGGLDSRGRPKNTLTSWQQHSLRVLIAVLLKDYPGSRVCGHRDLSPDRNGNGEIEPEEWIKECPCFDVSQGGL